MMSTNLSSEAVDGAVGARGDEELRHAITIHIRHRGESRAEAVASSQRREVTFTTHRTPHTVTSKEAVEAVEAVDISDT